MPNPIRAMYWQLRKQGLSDKEARARVKTRFGLRKARRSKRRK